MYNPAARAAAINSARSLRKSGSPPEVPNMEIPKARGLVDDAQPLPCGKLRRRRERPWDSSIDNARGTGKSTPPAAKKDGSPASIWRSPPWSLEFGVFLEFGVWNLEFSSFFYSIDSPIHVAGVVKNAPTVWATHQLFLGLALNGQRDGKLHVAPAADSVVYTDDHAGPFGLEQSRVAMKRRGRDVPAS